MTDYAIDVRQPQPQDIVGSRLHIAARGTAFEASYEWKLTRANGDALATGYLQQGSMGIISSFVHTSAVEGVTYLGPATFEFNADSAGGEGPEPIKIPVVVIPGATGFVPYRVKSGDTLTKIVQNPPWSSDVLTVESIVVANQLSDPDHIEVDQLLRLPV